MKRVWIMGCGDIGRRVARLYQSQGVQATGWVRGQASLALGEQQGIAMRLGDLDQGCFFPRNAFEGSEIFWFMPCFAEAGRTVYFSIAFSRYLVARHEIA